MNPRRQPHADADVDAVVNDGGPTDTTLECRRVPVTDEEGEPTGFEVCEGEESSLFRATARRCPAPVMDLPECAGTSGDCVNDADCTDGPNAQCTTGGDGGCSCVYQCSRDADCVDGEICACGGALVVAGEAVAELRRGNQCVPAACVSDADCGVSGCGVSPFYCGESLAAFVTAQCHTARDECEFDTDCGPDSFCAYDPSTRAWNCGEGAACE